KFATVFFNEQNLLAFLRKYREKLTEKLNDIEGKEEWGVKIRCDEDGFRHHIVENDPQVVALDGEIASSSPGKAYLLKRKRQQLIEDVTGNNMNLYRELFMETFRAASCEVQANPLPPENPNNHEADRLILNLAVLIEQTGLQEFSGNLEKLEGEFQSKGFRFDCSGPWPPYNFSRITTT
ncbi:MAG: GvpL/GvpF family gas vesicle protein, partial [Victivallaceae bacterium]|nr:GvpL/GvpF family gas vesicle protein [Victivallaceae bacterium]